MISQDEKRLAALFQHAAMGIVIVNAKGEITDINPFALTQFGYAKEELLSNKIEILIPNRFHHAHVGDRDAYIDKPKHRPMGAGMVLFAVKKNGVEFPVEVSLGNFSDNNEKFVVAFINDISVRKKAENDIAKLNDKLEETVEQRTLELTNAMRELEISKEELSKSLEKEKELGELKSRFVSMASHEFRTPLSTVLSSAYLVEKYTNTEDQQKRAKHLQRIISSVHMLTDILNDFLGVGKIEEGQMQVRWSEFNIQQIVETVIQELQENAKQSRSIFYSHEGDVIVKLDSSFLKHIVMNLISNAIKFSNENGIIEVSTTNKKNKLILCIKDNGIGISKDDQEHLMERFFRGANVTHIQGTGLGLHIVKKYVEIMDGNIICQSELTKGTAFVITFNK